MLKPCPFCGSSRVFFDVIVENGEVIDGAFYISCEKCQIEFSCGDSTKSELSELWNRRTTEPQTVKS